MTISDAGSPSSREISRELAQRLAANVGERIQVKTVPGQAVGSRFAENTQWFLQEALNRLGHLRPARWDFQREKAISGYDQYEHLQRLREYIESHPELETHLGSDYIVTPDIVIGRYAVADSEINKDDDVVSSDELIA